SRFSHRGHARSSPIADFRGSDHDPLPFARDAVMRARDLSRIAVLSVFAILAAGPARAQRSEDVVLAVPNVALTFAPGYLAEELGLFAKQRLNLKSVVIARLASASAAISGSA